VSQMMARRPHGSGSEQRGCSWSVAPGRRPSYQVLPREARGGTATKTGRGTRSGPCILHGRPEGARMDLLALAAMAALRRALVGGSSADRRELLRTCEPGWVLEVHPAAVDALRFEALVARARARKAPGELAVRPRSRRGCRGLARHALAVRRPARRSPRRGSLTTSPKPSCPSRWTRPSSTGSGRGLGPWTSSCPTRRYGGCEGRWSCSRAGGRPRTPDRSSCYWPWAALTGARQRSTWQSRPVGVPRSEPSTWPRLDVGVGRLAVGLGEERATRTAAPALPLNDRRSRRSHPVRHRSTPSPRRSLALTWPSAFAEERATGIEPAFSAWEVDPDVDRDLPKRKKVLVSSSACEAQNHSVAPLSARVVARMWHETSRGPQPRQSQPRTHCTGSPRRDLSSRATHRAPGVDHLIRGAGPYCGSEHLLCKQAAVLECKSVTCGFWAFPPARQGLFPQIVPQIPPAR
jgi:hypothetical protein